MTDSTHVGCARSRQTATRSDLVGFAGYRYCASHSRFFWKLRLHLLCTPAGPPDAFALSNPKIDEREVTRGLLEIDTELLVSRSGKRIFAGKGYASAEFETILNERGATLLRPAHKNELPRPGVRFLKPMRQLFESVNDTAKGQLDLEQHGGRTHQGVITRVLQRLLALTVAIWHNRRGGQLHLRPLIVYDP